MERIGPDSSSINEFNIFEILEILWKELWIIIVAIVFVTAAALLYHQMTTPKTSARFEYTLSFPTLSSFPGAQSQPSRRNSKIEQIFSQTLKGNWRIKNRIFTSDASAYSDQKEFNAALDSALVKINSFVLDEALARLKLMEETTSGDLQADETIVRKRLNHNFIVDAISNRGQDAVIIQNVSLRTPKLSITTVLMLGILFGICAGIVTVLFKNAYKKHQISKSFS